MTLSKMISLDELPFKFMEDTGFRLFMAIVRPKFVIPHRGMIGINIYQLYLNKKDSFKKVFAQDIPLFASLPIFSSKI